MTALPYQEMTTSTWVSAGQIGLQLRLTDGLIPLTDLAIAALALEYDHEVCTLDGHFDRIADLKPVPRRHGPNLNTNLRILKKQHKVDVTGCGAMAGYPVIFSFERWGKNFDFSKVRVR